MTRSQKTNSKNTPASKGRKRNILIYYAAWVYRMSFSLVLWWFFQFTTATPAHSCCTKCGIFLLLLDPSWDVRGVNSINIISWTGCWLSVVEWLLQPSCDESSKVTKLNEIIACYQITWVKFNTIPNLLSGSGAIHVTTNNTPKRCVAASMFP